MRLAAGVFNCQPYSAACFYCAFKSSGLEGDCMDAAGCAGPSLWGCLLAIAVAGLLAMLLRCSARQPQMLLVALLESSCEACCAHQYVPGAVKGTVACPLLVGAEICFRGGASVKTCSQGSGCELVHCTHGRKGVSGTGQPIQYRPVLAAPVREQSADAGASLAGCGSLPPGRCRWGSGRGRAGLGRQTWQSLPPGGGLACQEITHAHNSP